MDWVQTLRAAQSGEQSGIAAIFTQLQPAVLRYLRVCDAEAAEDIASATWMDVARNLASFQGDESAFTGWLFTIVRRRLIDHQRRQGRRAPMATIEFVESADTSVLAAIDASDAAGLVRRVLPDRQAEVVLLRSVAGLSVEETAASIGKSPTAVRVLHHRGLQKLGEVFTPQSFSAEVKRIDVSQRSSR